MILVLLILLAMVAGGVFYISSRLAWAFSLDPKILAVIIFVMLVLSFATIVTIMQTNLTSDISRILNVAASIFAGVFLILFTTLVAVDLVQLLVRMQPRVFGLVVLGLTTIISVYSLWNAQNIKTIHKDIQLPNLETPLRIAQLSDVHLGGFWGKNTLDRLVRIVEKENVDAVVITGDLFDGRVNLNEEVLTPLKRLTVPIYFVEGNHDMYSGWGDINKMLENSGIKVLKNEVVDLNGLQIVGLNYMLADNVSFNMHHPPQAGQTIKEVLPTLNIDKSRASVMLHHNPIGAKYASENGINLYLAGHTHAGQLFPATFVAKAMFEFNRGLHKYDDTLQVYVSQGSGTFGPPMRLGTDSEVTIINLSKQQ